MKKTILTSVCAYALSLTSNAQITLTLTQSDLPAIGTNFLYSVDSTRVGAISSAGMNQTWDYSNLQEHESDLFSMKSLTATPSSWNSNFPNSQMVAYENGSFAYYYSQNNSGYYNDGSYNSSNVVPANVLESSELVIPTPFTFNSLRNNTSKRISYNNINNQKIVNYTHSIFEGDATGVLTTPAGTFSNTLRIKRTTYLSDSVYQFNGTNYQYLSHSGFRDTTIIYSWYRKGLNCYLLSVEEKLNNGNTGLGIQKKGAEFYTQSVTSLNEYSKFQNSFIFPNPTNGENNISISVQDKTAEQIVIIDLLGKIIKTEKINNNSIVSFNIENLNTGMYIYKVIDATNKELSSGKLIVSE